MTTALRSNCTWREPELAYLFRYYETTPVSTIAAKLDRSERAVKKKAQQLGLSTNNGEYLSLKALSRIFGKDIRVLKRWKDKFGMPCRRIVRGKMPFYYVKPEKFWSWAEKHQDLIPWENYTLMTILPEPEWVRKTKSENKICHFRQNLKLSDVRMIYKLAEEGNTTPEISGKLGINLNTVRAILKKDKKRMNWSKKGANCFPEKLKKLRVSRSMGQEALAAELNAGVSTIQSWENGRHLPRGNVIYRIANFFQKPVEYFTNP